MRPMVVRLALFVLALHGAVSASAADTLLDIYGLALENDPNINIARLRVEGGEAGSQIARGSLLPQVTASGQWTENQVSLDDLQNTQRNFPGERRNIQLRQMLFNWQSISASRRASRVVDQRENELLEALGQLSLDVSERYLNVLLADRNVDLLQAEKTLVEEQLEEATALYERKLARITDLLETRARVDTVRTELINAENEAALAREEITALTGAPVNTLADVRESVELPPLSGDIKSWEARAIADNAMLLSKQDAVDASRMGVEEQRGGFFPTADLVLSYQEADVGFDNLQSPPREVEYIGVEVNIPLFRGGATRGRMREAWSNYYVAREEETAVRREVLKRVRSAWLNTSAAKRRVDAAALSVNSASTSYEAMRKARSLGSATSAAVLEALHNRTRSQRDYWSAVYDYLFNWLSLQRESGTLDADTIQQLDSLLTR